MNVGIFTDCVDEIKRLYINDASDNQRSILMTTLYAFYEKLKKKRDRHCMQYVRKTCFELNSAMSQGYFKSDQ